MVMPPPRKRDIWFAISYFILINCVLFSMMQMPYR
jgi:hypothetical protein